MSHVVELIAVGTELLLGSICNTNAQMLSRELSSLGLNVYYHTVVGDNPERLRQAVETAKKRADILITTGGLGPTCDDLTKTVVAACFGRKLVFHPPSAERIRAYFAHLHPHRPMTENNLQQAWLPENCTVNEVAVVGAVVVIDYTLPQHRIILEYADADRSGTVDQVRKTLTPIIDGVTTGRYQVDQNLSTGKTVYTYRSK